MRSPGTTAGLIHHLRSPQMTRAGVTRRPQDIDPQKEVISVETTVNSKCVRSCGREVSEDFNDGTGRCRTCWYVEDVMYSPCSTCGSTSCDGDCEEREKWRESTCEECKFITLEVAEFNIESGEGFRFEECSACRDRDHEPAPA